MSSDGISIIGSGWVGVAIGKGFSRLGFNVIFYDVVEKDLPNFTTDIEYAVENSEISFIAVPTPSTPEGIDLSYIKNAVENIGKMLKNKDKFHLVVVKSTVVPTTTEKVVIPILEERSGQRVGVGFGVCMNPEFLTEIASTWSEEESAKRDFFSEDRIVIGEYDRRSGDILEEIYKPLNKPIFRTDLKTAEIIKYASNCMLATKISYWNEIFMICKELGIDSQIVAEIVALDPRIGKYGTVHGKAFGGKCLPKDLKAFISFADKYHKVKLLKAVDEINEEIGDRFGVRE
ncbi:MAG: Nucleotide sugar dehydrogenase [Candidatus Syntrophoarchaeum caldarius]|uniref:UDP-N-acetyl-D-mannosamine dehydrogenase n=1 Tax=Candidatus Syntropharchaeum caldarium TaxID=1838285 RepID=A0A1F2P8B2_9EURY|nr:MAG: Nucleotide sugar dehydrogenase [Candidatus Syntrophoarchaeum caldarius]